MSFDILSVQDGILSDNVFCTYQDKDGVIWIGTSAGLNRYDGQSMKLYDIFNTPLSHNKIFAIAQDTSANLWIGTENGINVLDTYGNLKKIFLLDPEDQFSLSDERISFIKIGRKGNVWIGTNNGTIEEYIGNDRFRIIYKSDFLGDRLKYGDGRIFNPVDYIGDDLFGNLWIRHLNGRFLCLKNGLNNEVNEANKEKWQHLDQSLTSIGIDKDGIAWALEGNKLLKFDHQQNFFSHYKTLSSQSKVESGVLHYYDKDKFCAVSETRIESIDRTNGLLYDQTSIILNNRSIRHGMVDLTGSIWLATRKGVGVINPNTNIFKIDNDHQKQTKPLNDVFALLEDSNKNIYYHSDGDIVKLLPGTKKQEIVAKIGGINHEMIDDGEVIWAANSENGLCKIHKNKSGYTSYTLSFDTRFHTVKKVSEDKLWVGVGSGLFAFDVNQEQFSQIASLDGRVLKIIKSGDESVWVATSRGLYQFDSDLELVEYFEISKYRERGLKTVYLHTIFEGPDDFLYLGSESGGLIRLNPETREFRHLTTIDGLANNNVSAIVAHDNFLWISTYFGLSSFDLKNETFKNYFVEDGLSHNTFNMNSVLKTSDGKIHFGTKSKLLVFDPAVQIKNQQDKDSTYDIPLVLTELTKRDGNTNETFDLLSEMNENGGEIELNYNDTDLRISFALTDFTNPLKSEYAYFLEGVNEGWQSIGNEASIYWPSLAHGNYLLRIKGKNAKGTWSKDQLSIAISVNQVFYKTSFFVVLLVIIITLMIYLFFRFRVQRLNNAKILLESTVKDRTQEIFVQKNKIEQDKGIIEGQAQKLKELNETQSRWFTNIAHELRTPVTLILGPIRQFLSAHSNKATDGIEDLALVERNSNRLLRLVNEILDVSRLESNQLKLHKKVTSLTRLISESIGQFESLAKEKGVILSTVISDEVDILIDESRIQNILINLISNALKFTHVGGEIVVSVACEEEQDVTVVIKDTGDGISEKDIPYVFERYYQAEHPDRMNQGGFGIGLALCRELAQLHGGTLTAKSELGKGSIFILALPSKLITKSKRLEPSVIAPPDSTSTPDYSSVSSISSLKLSLKPTILLVEDNADMREYIQSFMLKDYEIMIAMDGVEALECLRELTPEVIISDVMMPRMNGIQLARKVKEHDAWKHIPFVTLTSLSTQDDKMISLRIGVDDYICKPFDPEELIVRVKNLINNLNSRKSFVEKGQVMSYEEGIIEQLQNCILTHIDSSLLSIEFLADEMSMSKRKLQRFLKETTGFTPVQFIREIKLQKALQLLENKVYPTLSEVVHAIGFERTSYFNELFEKRFGKKPRGYF